MGKIVEKTRRKFKIQSCKCEWIFGSLGAKKSKRYLGIFGSLRPTICSSKLLGMNLSCLLIQKVAFDPSGDQLPNKGTDNDYPPLHHVFISKTQVNHKSISMRKQKCTWLRKAKCEDLNPLKLGESPVDGCMKGRLDLICFHADQRIPYLEFILWHWIIKGRPDISNTQKKQDPRSQMNSTQLHPTRVITWHQRKQRTVIREIPQKGSHLMTLPNKMTPCKSSWARLSSKTSNPARSLQGLLSQMLHPPVIQVQSICYIHGKDQW